MEQQQERPMDDLIERLNHSGKRLSKGHRRIAEYIMAHYDKAVFMTASRLGESVGLDMPNYRRVSKALHEKFDLK